MKVFMKKLPSVHLRKYLGESGSFGGKYCSILKGLWFKQNSDWSHSIRLVKTSPASYSFQAKPMRPHQNGDTLQKLRSWERALEVWPGAERGGKPFLVNDAALLRTADMSRHGLRQVPLHPVTK
jgi:hypothetical protein